MNPEKSTPPEDESSDTAALWSGMDPDKRYRLKARLGQGGMATVHKAFDRTLRRNVALKMLRSDRISKKGHTLHRFMEEAQITSQIQHPGIVSLFDAGMMQEDRPFFTMNLVSGLTLEEILDDAAGKGSLWTQTRLLQVFLKVCETLAFAHSRGVIHRDLKPSNIMVGEYGEVVVMDWGISKIMGSTEKEVIEEAPEKPKEETQGFEVTSVRTVEALSTQYGQMIGTPQYMPPEQARGRLDEVDERSDIYSLGVILYEILTGGLPFEEEVYLTFQYFEREALPPHEYDPGLHAELSRICMRCMAPQRDRRYPSVKELIHEIHQYLDRTSRFERRLIRQGLRIISKGDEAAEAYLILKGKAEVYDEVKGKKITYAVLEKGDTFGELAVFTGEKRTAHLDALTDMEVLVFDKEKIREELNKVQPWIGDMITSLADKLAKLNLKYSDQQTDLTKDEDPPS